MVRPVGKKDAVEGIASLLGDHGNGGDVPVFGVLVAAVDLELLQ